MNKTRYLIKNKLKSYTEITYSRFIELIDTDEYEWFRKNNVVFIYKKGE